MIDLNQCLAFASYSSWKFGGKCLPGGTEDIYVPMGTRVKSKNKSTEGLGRAEQQSIIIAYRASALFYSIQIYLSIFTGIIIASDLFNSHKICSSVTPMWPVASYVIRTRNLQDFHYPPL